MGKIYIRIDDRLIHGQIITAWVKYLDITHIIAVDNELAKNEVMKSVMLMGIPREYKPRVIDSESAKRILDNTKETTRVLLVTRHCRNLKEIEPIVYKSEGVNIGNTSKQNNEKLSYSGFGIGGVISLNEDDVFVIKNLIKNNIKISIQQMPNDKEIFLKDLIE